MVDVGGFMKSGFEGVGAAFAANFDLHGDVGAGFALHVDGELVVDIRGGVADPTTGDPYGEDTLQLVFSTTKGATAICANMLIERGELDPDAPVTKYWPEFGAHGKEGIPVRWLLCHKAGLPFVDGTLTLEEAIDWDTVCERLAATTPIWEPGTAHGYHAVTYGHLVGEVVRRITGKSLGTFFADEVASPLGLEFWIGLPAAQGHRVAPIINYELPTDPELLALRESILGPDTTMGKALSLSGAFGLLDAAIWNRPDVHRAEIPAANGITNARSLSRMYAALIGEVDGVRLLSPAQVERARTEQAGGKDAVLAAAETHFGLGFMLACDFSPFGGGGTFGHPGAGGSVGYADPERGIAFGYVMSQMQQNLAGDPRTVTLTDAVYKAL